MTGPFSVRRNADQFEVALSRTDEPLTERDPRQFAQLLAVVGDLRSLPELEQRPQFVADLRSRLMTEAETALLPQSLRPLTEVEQRISLPVRAHSRDRRLASVLGGAALIGAATSMAVAAQTALPGESLYAVKRAIEDAQTGIARGDTAKGQAMLANARGRLDEINELAGRNDPASVSALSTTLGTFTSQAGEASEMLFAAYDETGDEAIIMDLRSFTSSSVDRLAVLQALLPSSAHDQLIAAGERLGEIDRRVSQLCPTCGGPASIPPSLLSNAGSFLDVGTVIFSASQDPDLIHPVAPAGSQDQSAAIPDTISGQDVNGLEVPDLIVPDADPAGPSSTSTDQGPGLPVTSTDVTQPVNEVTKLLTGDLDAATSGLPATNDVISGVGTAVDGTIADLQSTVDQTTGSLLP